MSNRPPMFQKHKGRSLYSTNVRSSSSNAYNEVDLREEFDLLVYGDENSKRHGHLVLIRNMRRASNGSPIYCSCRGEITREADPDCTHCLGEGYLWDEHWHQCYSMYSGADARLGNRTQWMQPGSVRVDYKIFYFRFDTTINYDDKIVEIKLDLEGNIVRPYIREAIYKPQTINKHRSDNGRVEFITVYCREDSAIRRDTINE